MSRVAHCDFESRSTVDLKKAGLDVYARHADTDVWCMAWAIGDDPVQLWLPAHPFPFDLREHLSDGGIIAAHNSPFEISLWNTICVPRYGFPPLLPEQTVCTMSAAYAMALPGSLENAAAAVGLDMRKDQAGRRVMLQLSKPKEIKPCACGGVDSHDCPWCAGDSIVWHDDPTKLEKLYAYCKQDVEVERELHKRLLALSEAEQKIWQLDYRINNRGVGIDLPAVKAAIQIVEAEKVRLDAEMRRVTNNAVASCTAVSQLGDWIKWQGVDMPGVAKADVFDALSGDLPPVVRTALELRREAAKSSTAKLTAMVEATAPDGRLRNMHQYHGASTGRWAGRKVQVHNLPRYRNGIKHTDVERMMSLLHDRDQLDFEYGPVLNAISDCLRGFIVAAPGHDLIASDFANIEGRVLAWLAGEAWKLQAFRNQDAGGVGVYELTYAMSFKAAVEEITKADPRRQIGKVMELLLGFGGSVGALRRGGCATQSDDELQGWVDRWRGVHPLTVKFWYDLERAAVNAVTQPGVVQSVGRVKFRTRGSFLFCQLPSGRLLTYPYPRIEQIETPWGELKDALTYMGENALTKKWERIKTYGGKLAENITQAVARDLLAEAMVRVEAAGHPVVMHVHDEIVAELPDWAVGAQEDIEKIMAEAPAWAAGLPIATEGWRGKRYRK